MGHLYIHIYTLFQRYRPDWVCLYIYTCIYIGYICIRLASCLVHWMWPSLSRIHQATRGAFAKLCELNRQPIPTATAADVPLAQLAQDQTWYIAAEPCEDKDAVTKWALLPAWLQGAAERETIKFSHKKAKLKMRVDGSVDDEARAKAQVVLDMWLAEPLRKLYFDPKRKVVLL